MQRLPPVLHGQAAPGRLRRPRRALRAPLRPAQGRQEVDPNQRAALLGAKLRTLVSTTAGQADRRSLAFPGGAALAGDDGVWVLADTEPARVLGPALAVARRAAADPGPGTGAAVHIVVEEAAGLVARRAAQFAPAPQVWQVDGTTLRPAEAEPVPATVALDQRLAPFADLLAAAGADPVVEHGRLVGEVRGLEVARVEIVDGEPRLDVGVGRFDREANALLHADQPTEETLRRVVALVLERRTDEAHDHPLNRLARSRWLRWRLLQAPSLVGAAHLAPMAPVVEPPDLRTPWPAPATGIDAGGDPLVVVASVGVDLDLVPAAADARLVDGRDARLVLAVPPRDRHPVTEALAGALALPAQVVVVE